MLAFRDIAPQAKTHFGHPEDPRGLTQLSKAEEGHKELLGHLLYTAQKVAKREKLDKGFRVVINDGVAVARASTTCTSTSWAASAS